MREADELYVVVIEPMFTLLQRATLGLCFVEPDQTFDPLAVVARNARIRRIPQYHLNRAMQLDLLCAFVLRRDPLAEHRSGFVVQLIECVGEVHMQPLARRKAKALLLQLQRELQVSDGIRGHHQFEAEQAGQKMRTHVAVPVAALLFDLDDALMHKVDHFTQKCCGACRRVEHQRAWVGEASRFMEARFQQLVNAAHNEVDHGLRGVVNTARLA